MPATSAGMTNRPYSRGSSEGRLEPKAGHSQRAIRHAAAALVLSAGLCDIRGNRSEETTMTHARVTGVRSIELGVRDVRQSADFYNKVWALEEVSSEGDTVHFRATGGEHHVLTIRERGKPSLLGVHFAATDRSAVDQLCAKAKSYGVEVWGAPATLPASAGGGYGFRFKTPDGLPMCISSDAVQHPNTVLDRSRPTKISHVVLNSAKTDDQVPFFV